MSQNSKNFFAIKFPKIILSNEIVATILFVVNEKISLIKDRIDNQLNTDI